MSNCTFPLLREINQLLESVGSPQLTIGPLGDNVFTQKVTDLVLFPEIPLKPFAIICSPVPSNRIAFPALPNTLSESSNPTRVPEYSLTVSRAKFPLVSSSFHHARIPSDGGRLQTPDLTELDAIQR